MGITERVWSFFDDERGTECVEFALVGLVVACGTAKGMQDVQDVVNHKMHLAIEEMG
jgi:hypothetical protein